VEASTKKQGGGGGGGGSGKCQLALRKMEQGGVEGGGGGWGVGARMVSERGYGKTEGRG